MDYKKHRSILLTQSPKDFGFDSKIWNGQIITDLIKKEFGINYQKANIYIMLKKRLKLKNKKYFGFEEIDN